MEYVILNKTALRVSRICYGTMTFGAYSDLKESEKIFNYCLEKGINFFDTAEVYGGQYGPSEEILGKIIKGKRDKIIISTKVHGFIEPDKFQSRNEIKKSLEQSLKRLNTDYIDIYFLHWLDNYVTIEERLNTLNELVKEGKIRYIGTSNFDSWLVYKMLNYSYENNLAPISVMQELFNIVDFDVSREKFSLAQKEGIPIMVYSPLAGGFLNEKYLDKNNIPKGSRGDIIMDWESKRWKFRFSEIGYKMLNLLHNLAKKYNATISQIAISYLLNFKEFGAIIIGSRSIQQLEENLKAIDIKLAEEDINLIKSETFAF